MVHLLGLLEAAVLVLLTDHNVRIDICMNQMRIGIAANTVQTESMIEEISRHGADEEATDLPLMPMRQCSFDRRKVDDISRAESMFARFYPNIIRKCKSDFNATQW